MSEVPICRDCAHLVGVRSHLEVAKEWKCGHEANGRTKDVVSGSLVYELTCYEARRTEGFCDQHGKYFKLYEQPQAPAGKPARSLPSADSLLGELGL